MIPTGDPWEKLPPLLFHDYLSSIARGSLCDVFMADLPQGGSYGLRPEWTRDGLTTTDQL